MAFPSKWNEATIGRKGRANLDRNQTMEGAPDTMKRLRTGNTTLDHKDSLILINAGSPGPPENGRTSSERFPMRTITDFMASDHRCCDGLLVAVEQAVAGGAWERARTEFARFHDAMRYHFAAEESLLFPLFEQSTGMYRGPTQVMCAEHAQMRQLLDGVASALDARDAEDYAGGAETLLIMMQQHNVKEENVLYPMCDQHLADPVDALLARLQSQIAERENVPT
jgi:hemerythrin-like domain-containing protein